MVTQPAAGEVIPAAVVVQSMIIDSIGRLWWLYLPHQSVKKEIDVSLRCELVFVASHRSIYESHSQFTTTTTTTAMTMMMLTQSRYTEVLEFSGLVVIDYGFTSRWGHVNQLSTLVSPPTLTKMNPHCQSSPQPPRHSNNAAATYLLLTYISD